MLRQGGGGRRGLPAEDRQWSWAKIGEAWGNIPGAFRLVWEAHPKATLTMAALTVVSAVLPASQAPGVEQLRDDLHRQLRGRLLASDDPDALLAFADTPYGRDDFEIWSRALAVLPPSSSRLPEVTQHLIALDLELR